MYRIPLLITKKGVAPYKQKWIAGILGSDITVPVAGTAVENC